MDEEKLCLKNSQIDVPEMKQKHWNFKNTMSYYKAMLIWMLIDIMVQQNREPRNIPKHVSVQLSSVAQSCPTLCDPMDCSMPGLPVHHQLPEFVCLAMMKSFSALFHQGHEVTLLDDCWYSVELGFFPNLAVTCKLPAVRAFLFFFLSQVPE